MLRGWLKILPYFIVKQLALKYCERMPYEGKIVETFKGEGITLKSVTSKSKKVVGIKIEKLREIADYYNFPLAVFFSPIGTLKGTRQEKYAKAYEKLNKIKEILEED